jgi:hypothetical protein
MHDYSFSGALDTDTKLYEAWRTAMDVRKFEIELYWKRAAYFWTFIGLTLAAYGGVLTARNDAIAPPARSNALFAIACIGFVFSVAWYFVNRGSKFWQRNWEYQVDILESQVIGPLYKTVFAARDDGFAKLTGAYPFSVSNINHILSLFMVVLFPLLGTYALACIGPTNTCSGTIWPKPAISGLALLFTLLLFFWGKTSSMRQAGTADPSKINEAPVNVRFSVRTMHVSK